jgi:cytochrome oxidase assembly protein ShyY1
LFALVGVCLALAGVCTVAGLWQLQRYGEKRRANVDLRHGAAAAPVPVGDVLAVGRPAGEPARLRQVTAVGRYQPAGQVLVRQRTVGARAGFLVVTPLRTAGGTLLVVRGFVPAVGAATQSPPAPAPPAGEVTVTGRVYRSEPTEPAGALPAGQVERIDVPGLAHRAGAGPAYGGYVELVSSQPAEAAGLTPMPAPDLANPAGGAVEGQHLAYIVQWFFFALLALAAPVVLPTLDRRARVAAAAEPTGPTQPAASAQPATPAEPVDSAGQPAPLHAG